MAQPQHFSYSDPYNPTPNPALESDEARIAFWAKQARERITWGQEWPEELTHSFKKPEVIGVDEDGVEQLSVPEIKWFAGGKLNVAFNCVDRHVEAGKGEKVALYFEGEPGDREAITYAELQRRVARAAHGLEKLGVKKGDRVVIYLPVIPETIIFTLACARIGAIHSLVFGGFSAEALKFRVEDTGAKVLITTDGQNRRGTVVPVKVNADDACAGENAIEHVIVVDRTAQTEAARAEVPWTEGRDVWYHELIANVPDSHDAPLHDAEDPLFIIYTSGTTGKPKGLVHTMGGYLVQTAYTHALLYDLLPDYEDEQGVLRPDELSAVNDPAKVESTVHWCTADLAWVTAHTYEIYGPLVNGVTEVIYEGTPNTPTFERHFEVLERYGVTNYYTAPTLIRSLMGAFPNGIEQGKFDLSSVRLLGSVGESINPEAWRWLRENVGGGTASFIDTWWQSETGSTICSPRPHDPQFAPSGTYDDDAPHTRVKPGCATRAVPGVSTRVVDEYGNEVAPGLQGFIVVDKIGPSMARTVWGNPQRYLDSYWKHYGERGWFLAGDGAKVDEEGDTYILGRIDDVINISGHRLSTIEIESSLVTHEAVVEAGVCPVEDELTGHQAVAFVTLTEAGQALSAEELKKALSEHIRKEIGPIAKPKDVVAVADIPKTRSGKITRRLLGQLYQGQALGDRSSLQNEEALEAIEKVLAAR
ncbi:acetyl-coenzyme A synthetase [Rothia aerolata]|uniref:acetate--CoA ligase n=1 Tax=Rothia aerolata TaxID=1812262 RepID=A0A917IUF6_9MICC|nr:AMP-binding protein [Rothia aerolata]GGH64776.1 acetyl-coenzyme A synthetase [Rothia aerolata]